MTRFISIYILFTLASYSSFGQMAIETKPLPTPNQLLEKKFSSPILSSNQLLGFEKRIIQKLEDLEGYLNIVGNPDYDQELRVHAKGLALNLFLTGKNEFINEKPIKKFLDSLIKRNKQTVFLIESAEILEALYIDPNVSSHPSQIPGKLSFTLSEQTLGAKKSSSTTLPFLVIQNEKSFGKEKLIVWEVKLGKTEK